MSQVSEAIRAHHRELMGALAAQVAALVEGRPEADPQARPQQPHVPQESQAHQHPARAVRRAGSDASTCCWPSSWWPWG